MRTSYRPVAQPIDVRCVDGLSADIDAVAEAGPASHGFLRRQWYLAATQAYGGTARTLLVRAGTVPVGALPLVALGPAWLRLAAIPGCYWPFRSFPLADPGVPAGPLLDALKRQVRALRIGPVYADDPSACWLKRAAETRGWTILDRFVADSYLLDMAALTGVGSWPRASTLRKNRFHEKHLATHGRLDWMFIGGSAWRPEMFDALADIERRSWIAARTDGRDAKFTDAGHGRFWRAAAADPVLAQMLSAAMLVVDGEPMAFSFDLDAGTRKYAIANSYDPAVARHSPGKLLYYRNLVRALERGTTLVDWGAGDSGYKRTIGALRGPAIRDWILVRPGAEAWTAQLLRPLWRRSGHAPIQSDDGGQD